MSKCDAMVGRPLDDDIAVAVLIKSCECLHKKFVMQPTDMAYKEARADIAAYIERPRYSSVTGLILMDIGRREEEQGTQYAPGKRRPSSTLSATIVERGPTQRTAALARGTLPRHPEREQDRGSTRTPRTRCM